MIPVIATTPITYEVPLHYQISEIKSIDWKQKGCGVASLAMLVDFYKPDDTASVQTLLEQGLRAGAFQKGVGWTHQGLANLAKKYGLVGTTYTLAGMKNGDAFPQFEKLLGDGPVIASIHRNFDPKNSAGHLVVVTGFDKDFIYYNDPGKHEGKRKVAISDFLKGWKKSFIVVRLPADTNTKATT